jgi:hypothetical protein
MQNENLHPASFGNEEAELAHERLLSEARLNQTVEFAVAPGQVVESVTGRRLLPGEQVRLEDLFDPRPGGKVPHELMNELVAARVVLYASPEQRQAAQCPTDAEFSVAPPEALVVKRGVLAPGAQLFPDDVPGGRAQLIELAGKGRVTHRPPQVAQPKRPKAS